MQTVLVISANRFFRESLLRLFRGERSLRVLGALEFSLGIGEQLPHLAPEIVALNPEPDDLSFCASRTIHEAAPLAKILMIGMKDDLDLFLHAVRAGAVGYLLKDASPRQILSAAQRLGRNSLVCPQHLLWALFELLADGHSLDLARPGGAGELTRREHQLATLLAQGLGNKEIAERLNVSLGTVKSHVHSILQKTQSKSRAELAHGAASRS